MEDLESVEIKFYLRFQRRLRTTYHPCIEDVETVHDLREN